MTSPFTTFFEKSHFRCVLLYFQRITHIQSSYFAISLANAAFHRHDGLMPASSPRAHGHDSHGLSSAAALDDTSKAIIEQLQQDGRRSYSAIGNAVGLSEAAVRHRVQRLITGGIVQIVAVTDPLQVGFTRQAMIGIRAEGDLDPIVATLTDMDEVDYVVVTAGSFDILAEVVCENDDHLLHLLNDKIRTIDGVRSTESFVYLKLAKQIYTWGTR